MALSIGIVGLPNVGKSTLFNALSAAGAQAANYPFCTIEPNVGVVPVPDRRFDALCEVVEPESAVPATVDFVDIKRHYYEVHVDINPTRIVPQGPDLSGWVTPHGREALGGRPPGLAPGGAPGVRKRQPADAPP